MAAIVHLETVGHVEHIVMSVEKRTSIIIVNALRRPVIGKNKIVGNARRQGGEGPRCAGQIVKEGHPVPGVDCPLRTACGVD